MFHLGSIGQFLSPDIREFNSGPEPSKGIVDIIN